MAGMRVLGVFGGAPTGASVFASFLFWLLYGITLIFLILFGNTLPTDDESWQMFIESLRSPEVAEATPDYRFWSYLMAEYFVAFCLSVLAAMVASFVAAWLWLQTESEHILNARFALGVVVAIIGLAALNNSPIDLFKSWHPYSFAVMSLLTPLPHFMLYAIVPPKLVEKRRNYKANRSKLARWVDYFLMVIIFLITVGLIILSFHVNELLDDR